MQSEKRVKQEGWVYVFANPRLHELVKVGRTRDIPNARAQGLSSTGVPYEYEVAYRALVSDYVRVELEAHRRLAVCHEAKEFFRCVAGEAAAIIRQVAGGELLYERPAATSIAVNAPSAMVDDEFAAWVRRRTSPSATFISSSALFEHWLEGKSSDAAEPRTVKAMVVRLHRLGFQRKKQGGSGLRGFIGLKLQG